MVSLKKNSKGELVDAKSFRTTVSSLYVKGNNKPFKISRSKFTNFIKCSRCFYLDRVKGLKEPSMPGWALNSAVDELLKKEFDFYRKKNEPHPIMIENKLDCIPFSHKDINVWQDSMSGGISYLDDNTNFIIYGGVDDIWFNTKTEELVAVDYKSQSQNKKVETKAYLNNMYHQDYKIQMDIYVHILRKMKFKVCDTSYFLVCNGLKSPDRFDKQIQFENSLVPYTTNTDWIDPKIQEMKKVLDSDEIPDKNPSCENCAYLTGGSKF